MEVTARRVWAKDCQYIKGIHNTMTDAISRLEYNHGSIFKLPFHALCNTYDIKGKQHDYSLLWSQAPHQMTANNPEELHTKTSASSVPIIYSAHWPPQLPVQLDPRSIEQGVLVPIDGTTPAPWNPPDQPDKWKPLPSWHACHAASHPQAIDSSDGNDGTTNEEDKQPQASPRPHQLSPCIGPLQ